MSEPESTDSTTTDDSTTDTADDSTTESTDTETPQEGDEDTTDDWRKDFDPERARKKIAKQNSELKNLRERAKAAEQKADGVSEETQKRIDALEAEKLRFEVAFEIGLPKELVPRLQGSTKEELLADADSLLELVSPAKRPPTNRPQESLRGGGEPEREPEETDPRKIAERMFRT
jgi:hypothetical protein